MYHSCQKERRETNTRKVDGELGMHELQDLVFSQRSPHLFLQSLCVRFCNYYLTNEQINSKNA